MRENAFSLSLVLCVCVCSPIINDGPPPPPPLVFGLLFFVAFYLSPPSLLPMSVPTLHLTESFCLIKLVSLSTICMVLLAFALGEWLGAVMLIHPGWGREAVLQCHRPQELAFSCCLTTSPEGGSWSWCKTTRPHNNRLAKPIAHRLPTFPTLRAFIW